MWVLHAVWREQVSHDVSKLRSRRLTAALFTLSFLNPRHSLHPDVTPYNACPKHTHTVKQTHTT